MLTCVKETQPRAKLYGRLIREARIAEGLTQEAFAQAVIDAAADEGDTLSLSKAAVCRWEAGRFEPAVRYRPHICTALRISRPALDRWLAGEIDGQGHPVTGTTPTTPPAAGGSPAVDSVPTAGVRSHPR